MLSSSLHAESITYESKTTNDDHAESWGVHGSSTGEGGLSGWGWLGDTSGGNGWLCNTGGGRCASIDGDSAPTRHGLVEGIVGCGMRLKLMGTHTGQQRRRPWRQRG